MYRHNKSWVAFRSIELQIVWAPPRKSRYWGALRSTVFELCKIVQLTVQFNSVTEHFLFASMGGEQNLKF
jgi:hypothetical protein